MDERTVDFDAFVSSYGDALLRTAYLLCGDDHRAHDLVQSALEKALRSWSKVAAADLPVAYVRRIVVREHLSWLRRRSSAERPVPAVDVVELGDDVAAVDARDLVWRALATLPRQQRAVLVLRLFEDLSDDDIAGVLGCRPSTVRAHASRALATLRTYPGLERPGRAETTP
jgi:RNA polymerase sigma-70 factor (sigma-E family)